MKKITIALMVFSAVYGKQDNTTDKIAKIARKKQIQRYVIIGVSGLAALGVIVFAGRKMYSSNVEKISKGESDQKSDNDIKEQSTVMKEEVKTNLEFEQPNNIEQKQEDIKKEVKKTKGKELAKQYTEEQIKKYTVKRTKKEAKQILDNLAEMLSDDFWWKGSGAFDRIKLTQVNRFKYKDALPFIVIAKDLMKCKFTQYDFSDPNYCSSVIGSNIYYNSDFRSTNYFQRVYHHFKICYCKKFNLNDRLKDESIIKQEYSYPLTGEAGYCLNLAVVLAYRVYDFENIRTYGEESSLNMEFLKKMKFTENDMDLFDNKIKVQELMLSSKHQILADKKDGFMQYLMLRQSDCCYR